VVESRGLDVGASRARPRPAGFSILEVLVVVMVLGLLAAVMVFVVRDSRSSSTSTTACAVERNRIETALASYKRTTGEYPPSLITLTKEPYRLLRSVPEHHLLSETHSRVIATGVCARDDAD
jgi:general secretion pathway protein G